jgi:chorismate mutase
LFNDQLIELIHECMRLMDKVAEYRAARKIVPDGGDTPEASSAIEQRLC